jgi:DNA-binding MarR family transcriptional regulator
MSNKLPKSPARPAAQRIRLGPVPATANGAPANGTVAMGLLPNLLGYQLRLAQRAIFDDFAEAIGELEVSPGLFGMLVETELANAAQLDRSSLVPALDKLEARGLVARRASAEDRRVNGLWLTQDGTALLKKLKQRVARHEQRLAQNLSEAEREQLIDLLQRILPERR